jgi:two-component system, cell cycle sensor histidine kinase DivJ
VASLLSTAQDFLDGLVHDNARGDALQCARHRAFIAPRLLGSCAALAAVPLYLALRGAPSLLEAAVFGWMIVPLLLATFLSRTGCYEHAHMLSALTLTGLVTLLAWQSGGTGSFAAMWLILVPLEAALSGSRRTVAIATLFALAAAVVLLAAPTGAAAAMLPALSLLAAALYGTGLAFGLVAQAHKGLRLLQAEEERHRLLAHNMTDMMSRHARSGAVQFVSPAAQSLLGAAPATLMGQGLFDRVHVADRPAYLTALADAAGGQSCSLEFRLRRDQPDGKFRFVWVEMRCHVAEKGDVVAVFRDISERKANEATLAQARAESDRANEGKSRFLATMSHELRTPLNAIIGFSEMLATDAVDLPPARRREYAKLINDSGRHLLSVVNGILDMSKMDSGAFEITPEPFAPGPVVASCCDLLALKAREADVALNLRIGGALPEITADRRALSQILLNLVSNAIKFTERGGRVTVSASCDVTHFSVVVEDTGVGIGEADLPRIGEPFFQARSSYDRRHDGTGLGLSIVKGLVRLHAGSTEIRSQLGEGTRVVVRLPLNCEIKQPAARPIALVRNSNEVSLAEAREQVRKRA